ncbi:hypothetical protein, partial [Acinetobacter baumannii]|uniref:hypothetical protein n=1 Tax=Acinetobacter baumannii TaxID=470 RepID=UPI001C06DABD
VTMSSSSVSVSVSSGSLDGPLQRYTFSRRWVNELDIEWYDAVLKAFPRAKFEPFVEISIFDKVMWFLRLVFFAPFI